MLQWCYNDEPLTWYSGLSLTIYLWLPQHAHHFMLHRTKSKLYLEAVKLKTVLNHQKRSLHQQINAPNSFQYDVHGHKFGEETEKTDLENCLWSNSFEILMIIQCMW